MIVMTTLRLQTISSTSRSLLSSTDERPTGDGDLPRPQIEKPQPHPKQLREGENGERYKDIPIVRTWRAA